MAVVVVVVATWRVRQVGGKAEEGRCCTRPGGSPGRAAGGGWYGLP